MEAGVACGNATETSSGGKLKYELLALCSGSSESHGSWVFVRLNNKILLTLTPSRKQLETSK